MTKSILAHIKRHTHELLSVGNEFSSGSVFSAIVRDECLWGNLIFYL